MAAAKRKSSSGRKASDESDAARTDRAREIARRLIREYPDAACRLNFSSPYELVVAAILAAQCTDDKVNEVTPDLFREAPTPKDLAAMHWRHLESLIKPTGFYRNKRKSLQGMARRLVEEHDGHVPRDFDALTDLPGVARKTANMVRASAFGLPGIICDTHVIRLSGRMGLTENERPEKIEQDLAALLPEKQWSDFSHAMLFHGRAVCQAKKPACDRCVVSDLCPSAYAFPHLEKGDG
jgi:endonuclease-3